MSVSEERLAADGVAYTYADFERWYGTQATQMWEAAAATEHSQSVEVHHVDIVSAPPENTPKTTGHATEQPQPDTEDIPALDRPDQELAYDIVDTLSLIHI